MKKLGLILSSVLIVTVLVGSNGANTNGKVDVTTKAADVQPLGGKVDATT